MKKTVKKTDFKHGQWFKANVNGEDCVGKVSIDEHGVIYLCQNEAAGKSTPNKLGFNHSWCVDGGSANNLKTHDVLDLVLLSRKPAPHLIPIELPNVGSYRARITNGGETVKVGCTPVSRELYLKVGRMAGWIE